MSTTSTGATNYFPSGEAPPDDSAVVTTTIKEVADAARQDFNFFAALCIPEVFKFNFPPELVSIFQILVQCFGKDRDFTKIALALPRGHGKSTMLKILIAFIILFTRKKFILIVCATEQLAINIIADVQDILDSPNIVKVFGNWRIGMETDKQNLKKTFFRGRNVVLAGIGSGGSLRGLNIKNERPDCILCDDMQTKEEAQSVQVSKNLINWFQGTLSKARSPLGCTFLYIGNMYPDVKIGGSNSTLYTCLLRNFQFAPTWISIIVGAILADGKALWEQLHPIEQLLEDLQNDMTMGVGEIWFSEVMNDPTCGMNTHFDLTKMPEWDLQPEVQFKVGHYLLIDPSLGKKKSDAQVVGEFEIWDDSIPRLTNIHIKQCSAPALVEWTLEYAAANRIPAVFAESVAYQESLLQWFRHTAQKIGIEGIEFLSISPGGRQKNTRILQSFKSIMEHRLAIAPTCLGQWMSQVITFDPLKITNTDDILDVVAYGEDVKIKYPNEIVIKDFLEVDYYNEGPENFSPGLPF